MFVVSVIDGGQERSILAIDVQLTRERVIVQAGAIAHEFVIADLVAVAPLEQWLHGQGPLPADELCDEGRREISSNPFYSMPA
jgi:hypothetical protein